MRKNAFDGLKMGKCSGAGLVVWEKGSLRETAISCSSGGSLGYSILQEKCFCRLKADDRR